MHDDNRNETTPNPSFTVAQSYFSSGNRADLTVDQYCTGVRAGDITVLARTLTLIESNTSQHQQLADQVLNTLLPHTGGALRIGITGVPGVGKSTFIESFGTHLVHQGKK